MARHISQASINNQIRSAQRQAQARAKREAARINREIDRISRENQRRIDAHNRNVDRHNKRVVDDYNREVDRVNRHNEGVVEELNRRLRSASSQHHYTPEEQVLADRVRTALLDAASKDVDIFLSYAKIDGASTAGAIQSQLERLGVSVWFDEISIAPGVSQSLQMDKGLQRARAGVVVLTPAYLVGRFWTERELGALLHKETLIPVLDGVTFAEVADYSGILPDLAGFETARDSCSTIAEKIATAVMPKTD